MTALICFIFGMWIPIGVFWFSSDGVTDNEVLNWFLGGPLIWVVVLLSLACDFFEGFLEGLFKELLGRE